MAIFSYKKVGGLAFIKLFDFQISFCRSTKSAKQRLEAKRDALRLARYRKEQREELKRLRTAEYIRERIAARERLETDRAIEWFGALK
jgi:hypothetical protein